MGKRAKEKGTRLEQVFRVPTSVGRLGVMRKTRLKSVL
jgi:hypothetical protein